MNLTERKKRIFPALLAALALPLVVCVEAPFEIFGSNLGEFLFSLSDFLPFCLLFAVGGAAGIFAVLFFLPQKIYRFVYPAVVVAAFLFFLQGTYLNLGLTSLPGDHLEGVPVSAAAKVVNTVVWVAGLSLAVGSAFFKKRDVVSIVCLLLSLVVVGTQVINTVFVAVSNGEITKSKYDRLEQSTSESIPRVMSKKNLTTVSADGNVIVFIVDRFDENYAERAFRESPEVYGELTGFTWFQDHISLFAHTYPAVTWMLTNAPYSCDTDRVTYQNAAFAGETPIGKLSEAGYTVNVYSQAVYAYSDESNLPPYLANVVPVEHFATLTAADRATLAGTMIRMAFYRCLPFLLKGAAGNIGSEATAKIVLEAQSENAYTLDMKDVYETLTAEDFTLAEGKTYSYIHITGCHGVTYNENFETPTESEAKNIATSVRASFRIIDRYLREMKRLGVYEDATILITGDHGAALNDTREVREPRLTALFAKPSGSGSEPLRISAAQVSHEDLWATVFRSEGLDGAGDYGTSVFEVAEGTDRTRYHRWQTYMRRSLDEYVYEVTGAGKTFSNWREASREHWDKFLMD